MQPLVGPPQPSLEKGLFSLSEIAPADIHHLVERAPPFPSALAVLVPRSSVMVQQTSN